MGRRGGSLVSGLRSGWRTALAAGGVGALVMAGVVILVLAPLALLHRQDLPFERQYGNFMVSLAAKAQAGSASNPLANNPRAVAAGRDAYTGSCSSCHGADGKGNGVFGQDTYPPATDLTSHDAREKSDAELFWITKHGLSFTGMPAFEKQYNDQAIWSLVSYIRALQSGNSRTVEVPRPTMAQLQQADPTGNDVQRGAAIYFAQGCADCHGAQGNAPGDLALREVGETEAIRRGRPGMPAYGPDRISAAELADLEAYMRTFPTSRGFSRGEGERERVERR